jgi:hypothetical protein
LIHKAKTEEPKTVVQQHQTGLTGLTDGYRSDEEHRSDRCATTQSGIFKAEETCQDRKACVEAKKVAVAGYPFDGAMTKTSEFALEGHVSLVL